MDAAPLAEGSWRHGGTDLQGRFERPPSYFWLDDVRTSLWRCEALGATRTHRRPLGFVAVYSNESASSDNDTVQELVDTTCGGTVTKLHENTTKRKNVIVIQEA